MSASGAPNTGYPVTRLRGAASGTSRWQIAKSAAVTIGAVAASNRAKSHGASRCSDPLQAARTTWVWGSTSPATTILTDRGVGSGGVVVGVVVVGVVVGGVVGVVVDVVVDVADEVSGVVVADVGSVCDVCGTVVVVVVG